MFFLVRRVKGDMRDERFGMGVSLALVIKHREAFYSVAIYAKDMQLNSNRCCFFMNPLSAASLQSTASQRPACFEKKQ